MMMFMMNEKTAMVVAEAAKEVAGKSAENFDLFQIVFDSINPYAMSILKLALAVTLYSNAIKVIRAKKGATVTGNNPYSGITTAFLGYLIGKGIPIIIGITDKICDGVIKTMNVK